MLFRKALTAREGRPRWCAHDLVVRRSLSCIFSCYTKALHDDQLRLFSKVIFMERTCIICGVAANSREHVFPAALGGRRTNKGIYCDTHNGDYSELANIIANQMRFFNSQIGVVGDHQKSTGEVKPVLLIDPATKAEMWLTNTSTAYAEPRIVSATSHSKGGSTIEIAANSPEQLEAYVAKLQKKGLNVRIESKGTPGIYYPGTLEGRLDLGGTDTGLRAIAYIAQTFLAHAFPELARLPELAPIKEYTLNNSGKDFAWWLNPYDEEHDPQRKRFSHRVIVGHNADDNVIYARISLFGAFHYGVNLGVAATVSSRSVVFVIDPLAKHPPQDLQKTEYDIAVGYSPKPKNLTKYLGDSIKNGEAKASVDALMRSIQDFQRENLAKKWLQELEETKPTDQETANLFFKRLVSVESGWVLRLIRHSRRNFSQAMSNFENGDIAKILRYYSENDELDPYSSDGLSDYGRMLLEISSAALVRKLIDDFFNGELDQDRMEMLLNGGQGLHTVCRVVLDEATLKVLGYAISDEVY